MSAAGFGGAMAAGTLAAWLGCEAWAWLLPRGARGFGPQMARRVIVLLGRAGLVIVIVAVGVSRGHADAGGMVAGAGLGWLLAAGREAWDVQHRGSV